MQLGMGNGELGNRGLGKNLTDEKTWKDVQNGVDFSGKDDFDETPRFIRNFRDLATYPHTSIG